MLAQIKELLLAAIDVNRIIKQTVLIFVMKQKTPLELRPISIYAFF